MILCPTFVPIFFFAFTAVSAATTHFSADNGEILRNVLLTETGSLVLGSNTTLRRIAGSDLSLLQQVSLLQASRLLVGDSGGTYSGRILSCNGMSCSLLDVNNIASHNWQDTNVLLEGEANARGLFVLGRDGQSVLTVALENEVQPSFIVRGSLDGVGSTPQDFDVIIRQPDGIPSFNKEFLAVFENDGFSYFVTKQGANNEARLARVCNNDTSASFANEKFVSYFEIRLNCGGSDTVPTAAAFLPSDQTITLSVTGGQSQNLVCVFDLSQIHQLMTQKYDNCRAGVGSAGLARNTLFPCVEFDDVRLNNPVSFKCTLSTSLPSAITHLFLSLQNINECNLVSDLFPAQEVVNPLSAEAVFSLPLSDGQFTSLIHSSLDNVWFLFAGTNNGKIYQVYISIGSEFIASHTIIYNGLYT